jgi:hypothetical protein
MNTSFSEGLERPVDFSYDACWLECPECGDRVVMSFADRDNGESRTCRGGHDVSSQTEYPSLTDLDDVATDSAKIERLIWYHTSTRPGWPPTDQSRLASATHVGTFESAIENMFRRMRNQGDGDSQFFLHRVHIACLPTDVSPLGQERSDFMGNVWLSALYEAGHRVIPYVNVHEHPGSISLAMVPSLIKYVQTLAVPLSLEVDESERSEEVFAVYTAECDEINARRPSTDGISRVEYLVPQSPDTEQIVRAAQVCDEAIWAATDRYKQAMTEEHMPAVGYRTREKLLGAHTHRRSDPAGAHDKFRLLADLVQNPARTLVALQTQPARELGGSARSKSPLDGAIT